MWIDGGIHARYTVVVYARYARFMPGILNTHRQRKGIDMVAIPNGFLNTKNWKEVVAKAASFIQ